MGYNYTFKEFSKDNMSRAVGVAIPISLKVGREICNTLRHMKLDRAKQLLTQVIAKKTPIAYKQATDGVGHKPGMAAGRYPIKASGEVKRLLEAAEANAQFQGLNTASLVIKHMCVQQVSQAWHHGRQRRRRMKRATVEVVLQETKKAPKTAKPAAKPAEKKAEVKKQAAPATDAKPVAKESAPAKEAPKQAAPKKETPAKAEKKESSSPKTQESKPPKQEAKTDKK